MRTNTEQSAPIDNIRCLYSQLWSEAKLCHSTNPLRDLLLHSPLVNEREWRREGNGHLVPQLSRLSSSFRRVLQITEQKRLLAAGEVRGRGHQILADG